MRSVATGSLTVFAGQVVANAGFFVAVLITARALGPEGRGTVAFVIVSALILSQVAPIGLLQGTMIFVSQRPALRASLLTNALVFSLGAGAFVGLVAAILLVLLGPAAPAGIGPNEAALLALGTVSAAVLAMSDAFLVGVGQITPRTAVAAVTPWIYAGLLFGMVLLGPLTVTAAIAAWVAAMTVGAIWIVGWVLSRTRPTRVVVPLLREAIAFGGRSWLGQLAGFLNMRVDQMILGVISTKAILGTYAVAVNGAEVVLYLPAAVAAVLSPALARMGAPVRHEQALRTFRTLAMTTAASVLGAALLGPVFLPLAFGSRFDTSVGPFLWLLPGAFGFAAMKVFGSALLASSATGRSPAGSISALVTGVVLDLVLIPPFGAVGAAAAASGAFLVGGIVALLLYRARFPFAWSSLVPGRRDVAMLGQLRARLASGLAPTGQPGIDPPP